MKKIFLGLLVTFFAPVLIYSRLWNGFFQQDEWYGFGWYLLHKDSLGYAFAPSVGHFNPLNILSNHLLFSIWGMEYHPFLIISLIFYVTVVVLVYFLAMEIFRSRFSAAMAAFIFSAFASHYQATAWVVADIGTHAATVLGLLSTIFFFRKRMIISLFFLVLSLLFKEIAIGLLLFYMAFWYFYLRKDKQTNNYPRLIMIVGGIYVLLRLSMFLAPNTTSDKLVTESQGLAKLVYNFITVPIKALPQSIIPIEILRRLSDVIAGLLPEKITGEFGSPSFEAFVVKRVLEAVSLLGALIITTLALIRNRSKTVILGLFWILINGFIFAFAPERSGVTFVIDSRNLYFVSVGSAILLTSIIFQIRKNNRIGKILLFLLIIIPNLYFLNKNLTDFTEKGSVRKNILSSIKSLVPDLPNRAVIYTESNQSYYGLPLETKLLPFQSGLGQTLLVWYYSTENFPKEFFAGRFLWDIDSQGYKEIDGRGFGYFRDMDLLKETVRQYNLPRESVFAFTWDGKRAFISEMSESVRQEIYGQKN